MRWQGISSPARNPRTLLTKRRMLSCKKVAVQSALCGDSKTFSMSHKGCSFGRGSVQTTSRAAPLHPGNGSTCRGPFSGTEAESMSFNFKNVVIEVTNGDIRQLAILQSTRRFTGHPSLVRGNLHMLTGAIFKILSQVCGLRQQSWSLLSHRKRPSASMVTIASSSITGPLATLIMMACG